MLAKPPLSATFMSTRAARRATQEAQRTQKALRAMSDKACELLLVRHGETEWNIDGRLQGQLLPGPPLTERGRRQAEVLAERLKEEHFDCIYSSDLLRASETAEIVVAARGRGEAVQTEEALRERFLGVLQGLTGAEAAQQHPEAHAALPSTAKCSVEGAPESLGELQERAGAALQQLAARHPGQRLLVITHGGFLYAAHKCATGAAPSSKNVNAAINTIRIEAGQGQQRSLWAVVRWGDADHLGDVGALASAFGGSREG